MDEVGLARVLAEHAGVVSRREVLALGGDDSDIERRLRGRDWAKVHPGVYVDHTGALSWTQRVWAALSFYWPAALSEESALWAHGLRSTTGSDRDADAGRRLAAQGHAAAIIHVAVAARRRVVELPGVRLRRITDFEAAVQAHMSPPRVRLEHALLDVAAAQTCLDRAIGVLADGCQSRRTTAQRLADVLKQRPRLPHRRFLLQVLGDVAAGAHSVLEHRYLTKVERPHGLPTGTRQRTVRVGRSPAYRDVEYRALHVVVELDGRLGHEWSTDRWDDVDRDIDSLVAGDTTLRAGWRQVLDPCRLAAAVGRLLAASGWTGRVTPCGPGCLVRPVRGGLPAAGAGDPPQTRRPAQS